MPHKSLEGKTPWMLIRYISGYLMTSIVKSTLCFYPVRAAILRFSGCKIENHSRIYDISFMNFYKHGFKNLVIGKNVYIGPETMIDIADRVTIGSNTTIAARGLLLTHTNVGYDDNPLKRVIPDNYSPVKIGNEVFIGANSVVLPGVTIGNNSIVGAMSLVSNDVESGTIVAGIPAKVIGKIDERA